MTADLEMIGDKDYLGVPNVPVVKRRRAKGRILCPLGELHHHSLDHLEGHDFHLEYLKG